MSTAPTIEAAHAMGANGAEAAGVPHDEAERLAFEAWMAGHCWALCATWSGTSYRSDLERGGYACPHAMRTRQLWAAWRDRAALSKRAAPDEMQRLRADLNSWISRGRGLTLADPEMAESMAAMKARIQADPEFARSLLRDAGIITDAGELAPEYGGPGSEDQA